MLKLIDALKTQWNFADAASSSMVNTIDFLQTALMLAKAQESIKALPVNKQLLSELL